MRRIATAFVLAALLLVLNSLPIEAKPPTCKSSGNFACSTPSPALTPSPAATPTAAPTPTVAPTATPSPVPSPTPNPTGCAFVEAQAWWVQTPGKTGTDFGHLHVGTCAPWKQPVSGTLSIPVRLILHNNPGTFDYLNPVLKTDSQEISLPHVTTLNGWTCSGTCTQNITLTVDTTLSAYDGVQEIRIRTYVREPDGNIMHASVNMLVDLRNGKPVNPIDRKAYARFKGWYTDSGYCEASMLSDPPLNPVSSWNPTIQVLNHGASDDLAVSRYAVRVDADAHAGIPGTLILSGNGQLQPTTINLSGLSSGTHKLYIRAECDDPRGSTNVGVSVVEFKVP